MPTPEPVNPGATNPGAFDILSEHFNPALKGHPNWDALLAALGAGDQPSYDAAQQAFDQLFRSTASGIYLERKAGDFGVQKPQGLGISDDNFRRYTIELTTGQVVENSLLALLEVFYGTDALRAHADSVPGPWGIQDGYDLQLLVDESRIVTVTFSAADFAVAGAVTALEAAASVTRALRLYGTRAYALAVQDPQTGLSKLRIYSGSRGLSSAIRVTGGRAQTVLQFPTLVPTNPSALPTWTITTTPSNQRTRFSPTSQFDVSQVRVGDYVVVYGTEFSAANRGTYSVVNTYWAYPGGVLTQWFEVVNAAGAPQGGVVQAAAQDLMVFRPQKQTTLTLSRSVILASVQDELEVVLPATSQAVGRQPRQAAYFQTPVQKTITALARDPLGTVTATAAAHGFQVGQRIIVDGAHPDYLPAPITAGSAGATDYSANTLWSGFSSNLVGSGALYHGLAALKNGDVLLFGGRSITGGVSTTNALGALFHTTSTVTQSPGVVQELFTWTSGAPYSLPAAIERFGSTYIDDGSATGAVWVSGGWTGAAGVNASRKFSGAAWTSGPNLNTARLGHGQSTYLTQGVFAGGPSAAHGIIVSGGVDSTATTVLSTAESLQVTPTIGTWGTKAAMNVARCDHSQLELKDGTIMVVGGRSLSGGTYFWTSAANVGEILTSVEIYDPVHDTWTKTATMHAARFGAQLVQLPNGLVLIIGGMGYEPTTSAPASAAARADVEIYDPRTGRCYDGPPMQFARDFFSAIYVPSLQRVYVAGGSASANVEYLDVNQMQWRRSTAVMDDIRKGLGGVLRPDGTILLAGGTVTSGDTTGKHGLAIVSSERFAEGGLCGEFAVTAVPDGNTFQYSTPGYGYTKSPASSGVTAMLVTAGASDPLVPGPYCFDPTGGVALTPSGSTTTAQLSANQRYASVGVADATQFPDAPGWLVFAFGLKGQVGPVQYLGRLSSTALLLDASYQFPQTVPSGSTATLLLQKGPYRPANAANLGALYLTGSAAGRVAAQAAVEFARAASVVADVTISYPGDRGLAGEGLPAKGNYRIADKVRVWGSDDVDAELATARGAT